MNLCRELQIQLQNSCSMKKLNNVLIHAIIFIYPSSFSQWLVNLISKTVGILRNITLFYILLTTKWTCVVSLHVSLPNFNIKVKVIKNYQKYITSL
jgi:hypothetical protein